MWFLGLSGGVDSTVAATLLSRAIGDRLHCIFVDNGLLRKDEFKNVLEQYGQLGLNVKGVDATDDFLGPLDGVKDPERKRKIIGAAFIDVFDSGSGKAGGMCAGWAREPYIRMSSNLFLWPGRAQRSNRTTMWAVCRRK